MPEKHSTIISTLNPEWHKLHRMPKNPTLDQRVEWHVAHMAHCACRKPTGRVREELIKRGVITA
jgi:hypothetical protein